MAQQADQRAQADALVARIEAAMPRPLALMEVCGTHTMAIGHHGLRTRMPAGLRLVSGPGCPVCVTPAEDVDRAIAMARQPGVLVTTFGDMMKVPGTHGSLAKARSEGAAVRVVYSPIDALRLAQAEPDKKVVFVGIGFETTIPTIAATMLRARAAGVENFFVLPAFKVVPEAMEALVLSPQTNIDGFICPGHVSALIGLEPYAPLAEKYGVPCVVTGFEALDILEGVAMLVEQIAAGEARVENQYKRAVPHAGNPQAMAVIHRVLQPCDAMWRGVGVIPGTGLEPRPEYASMDARVRIPVEIPPPADLPKGCSCGAVMLGLMLPNECPLFGKACTPASAVGPCMVSSEGACAAYHKYGGA
jgi:hydrogenase expression/formation protein HypD